jgi:hypothetical protein
MNNQDSKSRILTDGSQEMTSIKARANIITDRRTKVRMIEKKVLATGFTFWISWVSIRVFRSRHWSITWSRRLNSPGTPSWTWCYRRPISRSDSCTSTQRMHCWRYIGFLVRSSEKCLCCCHYDIHKQLIKSYFWKWDLPQFWEDSCWHPCFSSLVSTRSRELGPQLIRSLANMKHSIRRTN